MLARAIASGLSLAMRERRLVLLMWSLHLVLALVVAGPFFIWASGALGASIEGQAMLGGFDLALFADLMEESSSAIVAFALVTTAALAAAAIGAAFVSSGVLAVLLERTRTAATEPAAGVARPRARTLPVFFEGAGRFFWRNLGLMAVTAVTLAVFGGMTFALARAATAPLEDSLTEAGAWTRGLAPLAAGGLVILLLAVVLDFARIALVAGDRRGVIGTWWLGGRCVLRHLAASLGLWAAFALLVALAGALYLWLRNIVPAGSGPTIVLMLLMQQAFVLWRAAMRVGLSAGQIHLATEWRLPGVYDEPRAPVTVEEDLPLREPAQTTRQDPSEDRRGAVGSVEPAETTNPAETVES